MNPYLRTREKTDASTESDDFDGGEDLKRVQSFISRDNSNVKII